MPERPKLPRMLFPSNWKATRVKTSRIDSIKAAGYNQQRSKPTVGSGGNTEHKLDNNFTQPVPRTNSLTSFDPGFVSGTTTNKLTPKEQRAWQRSEKGKAVDKQHQLMVIEHRKKERTYLTFFRVWQATFRQGIDEYQSKVLVHKGNFKVSLYFCGMEALFVMEDDKQRFISKVYRDIKDAMAHYNNETISWASREDVKAPG